MRSRGRCNEIAREMHNKMQYGRPWKAMEASLTCEAFPLSRSLGMVPMTSRFSLATRRCVIRLVICFPKCEKSYPPPSTLIVTIT